MSTQIGNYGTRELTIALNILWTDLGDMVLPPTTHSTDLRDLYSMGCHSHCSLPGARELDLGIKAISCITCVGGWGVRAHVIDKLRLFDRNESPPLTIFHLLHGVHLRSKIHSTGQQACMATP